MKHLFVLAQNSSGSTLLYNTLGRCKKATRLDGEGPAFAKDYMPTTHSVGSLDIFSEKKDQLREEERYNWPQIKKSWNKIWDKNALVRVEKSTYSLYYAYMYNEHFENTHFIVQIRNPYAVCESIDRRVPPLSIDRITKHWGDCARQQIYNIHTLNNIIWVKYEKLCSRNHDNIIIDFIPELDDFNTSKWNSHNRKIGNLTDKKRSIISRTLEKYYREEMEFFGYEI